jgi:phosphotriesterase-related protein
MMKINSVLGPIDTAKLGFTLMHEHLMTAFAGALSDYPELLVSNPLEHIVNALKKAKEGGVDTVVDMTTVDLGRDINLFAEASRRSGVNVIACTGWWMDIPRFMEGITADQLAHVFVREIEKGIAGTNIKAGILKSASDVGGVTKPQEIILRAVAKAHLKTGVPIAIHTYSPDQVARQQLPILQSEGVNLKHVKVDHSNDTTNIDYLTWLLEQGCYLGLDRYPGRSLNPMERTRTMKALIDASYADKLCPSHDCSLGYTIPGGITPEQKEAQNPDRILYITRVVFPWLREMGVKETVISRLCIDGPRNFFEGK